MHRISGTNLKCKVWSHWEVAIITSEAKLPLWYLFIITFIYFASLSHTLHVLHVSEGSSSFQQEQSFLLLPLLWNSEITMTTARPVASLFLIILCCLLASVRPSPVPEPRFLLIETKDLAAKPNKKTATIGGKAVHGVDKKGMLNRH